MNGWVRRRWLVVAALVAVVGTLMIGGAGVGAKAKKTPTPTSESTAAVATKSTAGHPAFVVQGSSSRFNSTPAFTLANIAGPARGADTSTNGAIPGEVSGTTVDAALNQLITGPYAINVVESAQNNKSIVCGNIGGQITGKGSAAGVVVGLREENRSGYTGVAWLHQDTKSKSRIYVFLIPPKGKS